MTPYSLFPLSDYWWFYLAFTLFVLAMLALDLGVFHRKPKEVSFTEAMVWSVVWLVVALAFNYGFYLYADWKFHHDPRLLGIEGFEPGPMARTVGLQFLTGYIIERALAIDNIFVFVVIFKFFGVPGIYQHRVLFYGIIGALVFRILFIAAGAALMQFHWVVVAFGVLLLFTGVKLLFTDDEPVDPAHNKLLAFLSRTLPVTRGLEGQKFLLRRDGRTWVTPLFVALLFIELMDIVFALDSVPAIFAITREPLIVFTSNILAILGLRVMYFLLASIVHKFRFLKYGLGLVLIFVGLKMVWLNKLFEGSEEHHGHFPILWSLYIIGGLIGASIFASLVIPVKEEKVPATEAEAEPPSTPEAAAQTEPSADEKKG